MRDERRPVNPEMVTLARQSRGLSQSELASALGVSPGWISKIEGGIKEVPDDGLAAISETLDYPVEFFCYPGRVQGPGVSALFHRRRASTPARLREKHDAQVEVRRIGIERLLRSVELGEMEFKPKSLGEYGDSPSLVARAVRAEWGLPRGPVRNMTSEIERARGIVLPMAIETSQIDATSYWPPNLPPLFTLNLYSPGDRVRFSLAHELGHVVMHDGDTSPQIEAQANEFAAEFLMPETDIKLQLRGLTLKRAATLKPFWKVSMAALIKRAADLHEITPRHARSLFSELAKNGFKKREPAELDIPIERPSLLREIAEVYTRQLDYSQSDLAKLLRLNATDVRSLFIDEFDVDTNVDVRSAVEAAEQLLKNLDG